MVGERQRSPYSRRDIVRRTAALVGVAGGLAGGSRPVARAAAEQSTETVHVGFTTGESPDEGGTITVDPRCEGRECAVIRATGFAPNCSGGEPKLYVDLYGTDPTVWINPKDGRNANIRPGDYRVVGVRDCGETTVAYGDSGDDASSPESLFRVEFREA
ncbi:MULTISPECIES: hypothetical protein [Halorussus]|uniref:hypothetical protein n=1 Tax=Halorussus TaxID=1070314 RepID=UPI00209E3DDF|nr:hypothetical protein [Halorussus vallis]USZ77235.1 hypothetical protein NGM07_07865 [Halorussus vallis]